MRLLTLLLTFLLTPLTAQKTTTQTLRISAGGIHCTFISLTPPALTGIHIDCLTPTAAFQSDTTLAPPPAPGQTGKIFSGSDSLEWRLQLTVGPGVLYQVTANGKKETGSL